MVIIDKKSDSTEGEIIRAAELLENNKIRVIPVALGSQADVPELTNITLDYRDVIKADRKDDPGKVADEILTKASRCIWL